MMYLIQKYCNGMNDLQWLSATDNSASKNIICQQADKDKTVQTSKGTFAVGVSVTLQNENINLFS